MTLFRTVDGAIAWFDNAGAPINPDGSPRSGPTLDALGGADGTEPPGFSNPGATPTPAPAPPAGSSTPQPPAPPASSSAPPLQPSTFANLNVQVSSATTGAKIAGATVLISPDFGNGTTRTTDGNGFANFGVGVGYDVEINILAPGFTNNDHVIHISDPTDHWYSIALAPLGAGAGSGTGQPAGIPPELIITPGVISPLREIATHVYDVAPAPAYTRATFETRAGVPSITGQSFAALDVAGYGASPSSFITTIVAGLIGLFKTSSGGAEINRLAGVVQTMGQFVLSLASTLADFTARSVHTDDQGGGLFDHILGNILGPIINALASVIRGGSQDLAKLFGPISDSIKKLIGAVRHIYDAWLRPIIKAIDTTRQILRVLEAFHLKWAAAGDAALGRLEGKLSAPLLLAIKQLNKVANVVNQIVTLDGALQRVTLLKSLTTHATCVQRAIDKAPIAAAGRWPATLAPLDQANTVPMMIADATTFAVDGTGPWAADFVAWNDELQGSALT